MIVSYLDIAIVSPSFASLFFVEFMSFSESTLEPSIVYVFTNMSTNKLTKWLWVRTGALWVQDLLSELNKLAKLGDAIAISKSETITDSLTH